MWTTCFWNSIQQVRWLSHSTGTVTVSFNRYGDCLIQQIRWLSHSTGDCLNLQNVMVLENTRQLFDVAWTIHIILCMVLEKLSHLFGVSLTIHCTYKLFYKPKKYTNVNLSLKEEYFCPSFKCPLCDEPLCQTCLY